MSDIHTLFFVTYPADTELVCAHCMPNALGKPGALVLAECIVETSETCVYCGQQGRPGEMWDDRT